MRWCRAHASLLLQAEGCASEGAAAVFAVRGAGRGAGVVMGRRAVLLPALRVAAAAAAAPPGSLLSVSREETLPDSPRRGEKSRPWARLQVSRGRRGASNDCARGDAASMPDVEATVSSATKTRTMLGSEQEGGRPAWARVRVVDTARGG